MYTGCAICVNLNINPSDFEYTFTPNRHMERSSFPSTQIIFAVGYGIKAIVFTFFSILCHIHISCIWKSSFSHTSCIFSRRVIRPTKMSVTLGIGEQCRGSPYWDPEMGFLGAL